MIKVVVPRLQTTVLSRAMQVYGAMGLTPDTPLAFLWTWGRALRFVDGPGTRSICAPSPATRCAPRKRASARGGLHPTAPQPGPEP